MATKLSELFDGGVTIGKAVFLEDEQPIDLAFNGRRYLRSGTIETDSTKFDTDIFTNRTLLNTTSRTSQFGATNILSTCSNDDSSILIAVGLSGTLSRSIDGGVTWVIQTSGFGADTISACSFGAGVFIIGGLNGKLSTSPDGITWTARTSTFGSNQILSSTFGGGLFVIGGGLGNLATSPDGITWTSRTSQFGVANILALSFGVGRYIATGAAGILATSPTSVTWTLQTSGFTSGESINATSSNSVIHVIAGRDGKLSTSTDGVTWTARTSGFSVSRIRGADFGDGIFAITGDDGKMGTSPDGINWTGEVTPTTTRQNTITVGKDLIFFAGDSGELVTIDHLRFAGSQTAFAEFGENQYVRIS